MCNSIEKKIILAKKLSEDNHVSLEFFPTTFCVKKLNNMTIILKWDVNNGLYKIPDNINA